MPQMHERDQTVALIGGSGKMGVPTRRLLEQAGLDVVISDIADPATISAREAISRARIVFFTVLPIENIGDVVRASGDIFDSTHVVLDNATVKNPLKPTYEWLDQKGVSITSTHPLCKDDQPFFGQNVLIAPFGRNSAEATIIAETAYGKAEMVLIPVEFDRHDSLLLVNQLLPHLVNRAVGEVLAELGADPKALDVISTANSRLFSHAVWRTLVQNPEISALILQGLKTPEGSKIAKALQQALSHIELTMRYSKQGIMEQDFRDSVEKLDPAGETRAAMNERSTEVLELLANLSHHSITIEVDTDRPGLLLSALEVLKEHNINLNALASHAKGDGWKFGIGIADGEITPEIQEELKRLGSTITNLTVPKGQETGLDKGKTA